MRREAKAGLLALALFGLLLVVALAARGGHPGSDGEVTPRPIPGTVQDTFLNLLALAYIVVIVVLIVYVFRRRVEWQEPQRSRWIRNLVMVMTLMGIITVLGYIAITHGYLKNDQDQAASGQQGGQTSSQRRNQRDVPVEQAHVQWPLVLGVAGLIVLGGVALRLYRRRESFGPVQHPRSLEEELADAVGATIEDLRRERDPRRAVVAAYAQMERVLAAHGLRRRQTDAPLEYLMRILRELEVRESAVRTLTELFEYARFSPHEIDAEMKERAIEALIAVRDDLRVGEAVAA
jgi:Domain of unknown function (DUF4129)